MAVTFFLFLFLIPVIEAQSQECVQNLPTFENQGGGGVERLLSGTQAIIPGYSFECYGNVTQWGAFVEGHGGDITYNLDFQVWRRREGRLGTTGIYDFVGNNSFPSIDPPGGGEILTEVVSVEHQIKVCPGDVIGLYFTTSDGNGVELKQQDNGNGDALVIWFATSLPAALSTRTGVGSTSGYELTSTTAALPVITAVVLPSTLSSSPIPFSSSSGLPTKSVLATTSTVQPPPLMITRTGTSQIIQTLQTQAPVQFSAASTPQTSSFLPSPVTTIPPVGSGLPIGVIVAIVIVVLIVVVLGVLILVFILTLALRRRSKKTPDNSEHSELNADEVALEHFEMNTNDAYGTNTTEIATTGNAAYMTTEDAIPVTQNVAYGQVPPGTEDCYDYVI